MKAVDIAGLNLGVHYLKRGRSLLAGERFKEALQAFTSANSEPHRLATLLMEHRINPLGAPRYRPEQLLERTLDMVFASVRTL